MPAQGPNSELGKWAVSGHSIAIHYREDVVNSISDAAWEGLQKIPRRGLEVGGVLYGEREGDEVRILEWRPIACEHSSGPGFELSDRDKETLRRQLDDTDDAPPGLIPVGWFHSRTKDGIFLTEADIAIYNGYFPAMWQVTLVVRPHMYDAPRAGFFIREQDGSVQAERSHLEFELSRRTRRLPVGFDPSNPRVRSPLREGSPTAISPPQPVSDPAPAQPRQERAPRDPAAAGFDASRYEPPQQPRKPMRWGVWLAAAIVTVALLVLLGAPLVDTAEAGGVGLQATDTGGQLLVEWNHATPEVLAADSATLRVSDGQIQREVALSREELRTGSVTYLHTSGDVEFRLEMMVPGAGSESVSTRFVGVAPAGGAASPEDANQRTLLEAEAELLQRQLSEEADRNQDLRENVDRLRAEAPQSR